VACRTDGDHRRPPGIGRLGEMEIKIMGRTFSWSRGAIIP
jgi:hypothetical protein